MASRMLAPLPKACAAGALAAALLAALHRCLRRRWIPRGKGQVPGHWLLGNIPLLMRALQTNVHDTLAKVHEEYGDTVFITFGCLSLFVEPIVSTRDPRNVEHMLKHNFGNYPKGDGARARLVDLLGDGIFNVDGKLWHAQRKTASQMFTANRFKNHIWRVVQKNTAKVVTILQRAHGETIDMFNVMNRFTLDSIGEIGFGASIGSLENPESPFLKSFDEAQRIVFRRFVVPGWQLLRLLGLGREGEGRRHFRMLQDYSLGLVEDLATKLDSDAGDSFVGLFMKSEAQGLPNSKEFLRDLVLNFLIAGRDTTAQAMSWCIFLLTQHPHVESKLLQEVDCVCGSGELTYDQLRDLKYLEAVLNESLRLYPSVPVDAKFALAGDTLPDGTYVPPGAQVWYTAYAMGRSPLIWGDDAHKFRPERWLEVAEPRNSYENPVFHAGPRECLGKRLAMVEMKAVVASVLRAVKFELAMRPEEVTTDMQMTIGMASGLKTRIWPRESLWGCQASTQAVSSNQLA